MDKFTRRGTDGSVDVVASAAAYSKALTEWAVENEVRTEVIENAVEAAFDNNPGKMTMPSLIHFSLTELGATSGTTGSLTKRVQAYVKGQKEIGRISVIKGPNGGTIRVARPGEDLPAPTVSV
jgi:hypothetical protein